MKSLADHDLVSLAGAFRAAGLKPVHAAALLKAFYQSHGQCDLDQVPIGKAARQFVRDTIPLRRSQIALKTVASDGTTKILVSFDVAPFRRGGFSRHVIATPQPPPLPSPGVPGEGGKTPLKVSCASQSPPGGAVESVLMPGYRDGVAAGCVSSQIGCPMGCDFCASTRGGWVRNLDVGEIVEQFLHLRQQAADIGRRLRTVVFMGMGEPLLNYDAVVASIRRIADAKLGALGWRQITVSTVGIVPGIDRLAAENLNVQLALSLHAPDDATRAKLVPANRRYSVAEVMSAARRFYAATGRVPNIEYCMLAGVNDSDSQAAMLAQLMQGFRAHVNLIAYNPIGAPISGTVYQRPSSQRMKSFLNVLRDGGVVAHFRDPRGDQVNAACGQLRTLAQSAAGR